MKVLIADDHALFRDGLCLQLRQMDEDAEILEAGGFDEAIRVAGEQDALDLILLDLGMPGMAWRQALALLRKRFAEVPIVVVSASEDRRDILEALEIGATGYIPKSSSGKVMLGALKLVFSGGVYLPPALLGKSVAEPPFSEGPAGGGGDGAGKTLTPRQRQVLSLLATGQSNKEIARALNLGEGTIKVHVTGIMKALNVRNRTQAVVTATRLGLIPAP